MDFHVGDLVSISGATPAGYDGTFAVSGIVNSTTFTYIAPSGLAAATGTITASTNDQFNFAYEQMSGNVTVSAQLLSLTNADEGNGTPLAGVMMRSSTADNAPFVAMVQTANNGLIFEYRTVTGGVVTSASLGSVPVGAEYVEIVESNLGFSGFYSSNGTTWTQLGSSVLIAGMPRVIDVGLAASANFNSQLTSATFAKVNVSTAVPPVVSAFQVNDGSVQRSMVTSLTVTFNEAVTLGTGAITLSLLSQTGGASTPITNFNLNSPDGGTTWVLTFTDPSFIGGSLPDGAYEVSVLASGVSAGTENMAANQNFTFYRLYGDFEGTGAVTGDDFSQLVTLLGTATNASDSYVDYDGDGVISGNDFSAFVSRLGHSMSIPALPSVVLLAAAVPMTSSPAAGTNTMTATTNKILTTSNVNPAIAVVAHQVSKKKVRNGHGR